MQLGSLALQKLSAASSAPAAGGSQGDTSLARIAELQRRLRQIGDDKTWLRRIYELPHTVTPQQIMAWRSEDPSDALRIRYSREKPGVAEIVHPIYGVLREVPLAATSTQLSEWQDRVSRRIPRPAAYPWNWSLWPWSDSDQETYYKRNQKYIDEHLSTDPSRLSDPKEREWATALQRAWREERQNVRNVHMKVLELLRSTGSTQSLQAEAAHPAYLRYAGERALERLEREQQMIENTLRGLNGMGSASRPSDGTAPQHTGGPGNPPPVSAASQSPHAGDQQDAHRRREELIRQLKRDYDQTTAFLASVSPNESSVRALNENYLRRLGSTIQALTGGDGKPDTQDAAYTAAQPPSPESPIAAAARALANDMRQTYYDVERFRNRYLTALNAYNSLTTDTARREFLPTLREAAKNLEAAYQRHAANGSSSPSNAWSAVYGPNAQFSPEAVKQIEANLNLPADVVSGYHAIRNRTQAPLGRYQPYTAMPHASSGNIFLLSADQRTGAPEVFVDWNMYNKVKQQEKANEQARREFVSAHGQTAWNQYQQAMAEAMKNWSAGNVFRSDLNRGQWITPEQNQRYQELRDKTHRVHDKNIVYQGVGDQRPSSWIPENMYSYMRGLEEHAKRVAASDAAAQQSKQRFIAQYGENAWNNYSTGMRDAMRKHIGADINPATGTWAPMPSRPEAASAASQHQPPQLGDIMKSIMQNWASGATFNNQTGRWEMRV